MKKYAKFILLFIIVSVIGVLVFRNVTKPLSVEIYTVAKHEALEHFTEEGTVKANSQVNVYSTAQGTLLSVNVLEGQMVKAGDVICVVDSSDYEFNIAQAKSNIEGYSAQKKNLDVEEQKRKTDLVASKKSLQSEYDTLIAQKSVADTSNEEQTQLRDEQIRLQNILIAQNQSDLVTAQENTNNAKILFEAGVLSKSEYDKAANALENAKTALLSSQQQLSVIENGIGPASTEYYESMKKSLEAKMEANDILLSNSYSGAMKEYYDSLVKVQNANIDMYNKKIADCTIKAPVEGKITKLYASDTNVVNAATPVATITTETSNEIEVYIATKSFNLVHMGDTVSLIQEQDNGDIVFDGKITGIDTEAVSKLSSLGVEEKKVKITILPTPKDGAALFAGFAVDVQFVTYQADNQITVPKTAVFKDSNTDKDMVWVIADGKAGTREVTLGKELRTDYIITTGLSEGEKVVKNADDDKLKTGINVVEARQEEY